MTSLPPHLPLPLLVCGLSAAGLACAWRASSGQRAAHVFVTVAMAAMVLGGDSVRTLLLVLGLCLATVTVSDPWRAGCSPWHPVGCAAGMAAVELDMVVGTHSPLPGAIVTVVFLVAAAAQLRHVARRRHLLAATGTLAGSLAMVAMGAGMLVHA